MTEIPVLPGNNEDSEYNFDDETLDFGQYDLDELTQDTQNYDVLDEDKIELAESIERECNMSDECIHINNANLMPMNMASYFNQGAHAPHMPQNMCISSQNMGFSTIPMTKTGGQIRNQSNCVVNGYTMPNRPSIQTIPTYTSTGAMINGMNRQFSDIYFSNGGKIPIGPNFASSFNKNNKPPTQPHIKKPLNAFMLYMRDVRSEVLKQVPHKDSTTINQMIGKMWQALNKTEQAQYFEKARLERERHKIMYPEYNPRDYYAQSLKKKRRKRDRNGSEPIPKKCRARYGLEQQDKWCKHCKRKKKCLRYIENKNSSEPLDNDNINDNDVCTPIPNGAHDILKYLE